MTGGWHPDVQKDELARQRQRRIQHADGVMMPSFMPAKQSGGVSALPLTDLSAQQMELSNLKEQVQDLKGQVERLRAALKAVCHEAIVDAIQKGSEP